MEFYRWIQSMQDGHTMTPKEFEVAVMAASYCTGSTGEDIRPGAPRIAKAVNWQNPHRVYPQLKRIVEKGYLEVVEKGGKGIATEYRLSLPVPPVPHLGDDHRIGEGTRSGDHQSEETPSPDRVDHLATNTYLALYEEIEENDSSNSVDLETGEILDSGSGAPEQDWWDQKISAAWDNRDQLNKLGKALANENPNDHRLPGMRQRFQELGEPQSDPVSTPSTFSELTPDQNNDLEAELWRSWSNLESLAAAGAQLPDDHPLKGQARERYMQLQAQHVEDNSLVSFDEFMQAHRDSKVRRSA